MNRTQPARSFCNRISRKNRQKSPKGFALVVTVTLMVLITIVALGMLSLSAVMLRKSSIDGPQEQARYNARMALMIALGELQKHAGPDQRVTATADLAGETGGLPLAAGAAPKNLTPISGGNNGLSSMVPGTRHWTGVWRNNTAPAQIINRSPSPALVSWLVSGNETSTTTPNLTPSFAAATVGANGAPSDSDAAVILVGTNTVGSTNPDNFVAAPFVKVAPPVGTTLGGRYAWWIGDEGVKARINVAATQTDKTLQPVAHRGAWEVISGMENSYPTPESARHSSLNRVLTLDSAALIDSGLEPSIGSPTALFHTATTDSFGVLADSLQGGLRIDLTSSLENGFPADAASTFPNRPAPNRNILTSELDRRFANIRGPSWDTLREFYQVATQAHEQGRLTVKSGNTTTSSSPTGVTVAPIVLDFRVVLGARLVRVSGNNCKLNPCAKVAIVLANPYPYPLEWTEDLEFELIDETPATTNLTTNIYAPGPVTGARFLGRKGSGGHEPAVLNNAVFVIPKGELPPGEARAYAQTRAVTRPINDSNVVKVAMGPVNATSPTNFEICIELNTPDSSAQDFSSVRQVDVRESWTTSQPSLELRLAGRGRSAGEVLRRIERFEWDNAFHAATKLRINHDGVATSLGSRVKMPFPLKIYNSQISMPGMDYDRQGLPAPDMMGTRCSTLRTFADFNIRAVKFPKLITSYNPPPYYFDQTDNAITDIPPTAIHSSLPSQTGQAFTQNLGFNPVPWGHSLKTSQTNRAILFSFPRQFVSLAQLQHVDLTADDTGVSISQQPGNAVGNSYASPFVKRGVSIQLRKNYIISGINTSDIKRSSTAVDSNYYDMSYLLNVALWDTYFFSTLGGSSASGSSPTNPANPAMTIALPPGDPARLQDPIRASSHLLVRGALNVNSTSKDAWKAIFASTRFAEHPAGGDASGAMFPRSMEQKEPASEIATGNGPDSFAGYRRLTPAQIDALADQMVRQVRQRGPFLSLSHFVNRSLASLNSRQPAINALSRSGPLQSAIDLSGINISPDGRINAFRNINSTTDRLNLQADGNAPRADVLYPTGGGFPQNQGNGTRGTTYGGTEEDGSEVWAPRSADLNPSSVASIYADRLLLTDSTLKQEQGFRSTGIPGWLTQADILQAIGPVISARSDTFRIRAYGEAVSTDGSKVLAKAWCEAIVQRTPNYVDPANTPEERDTATATGPLTPSNRLFGRRFEIVSFRWLSSGEI